MAIVGDRLWESGIEGAVALAEIDHRAIRLRDRLHHRHQLQRRGQVAAEIAGDRIAGDQLLPGNLIDPHIMSDVTARSDHHPAAIRLLCGQPHVAHHVIPDGPRAGQNKLTLNQRRHLAGEPGGLTQQRFNLRLRIVAVQHPFVQFQPAKRQAR